MGSHSNVCRGLSSKTSKVHDASITEVLSIEKEPAKRTRRSLPFTPQQSPSFIRILSATKAFTPSHNCFFLLISSRLKCEGLLFQAFTGVHRPCECFTARVNALKSKPSHSKPLKINRKQDSCEWVNAFWGNNYVYIIARIRAREL